ncbi:ABC transporter ATP-binding protein [Lacisediminimonas profundi]|uniref:ABC transporter ATP-binding protein n=1 Tax=Lacisediminimonas profundi TaxID=2603856 RepID=UPI00124B52B1|nr:ABC transporter ATP-binding protein [Lacisediminimonas profundi]
MLELKSLAVDHGKLRALWDISLEVRQGEKVALLGANGAGKSTTIGAIAGIYPVAAGSVTYEGQSLTNASPAEVVRRGIAAVPEGRRLFTAMSVQENLTMGAYSRHLRGSVDEGLEKVFSLFPILRDKRRQNAGELSGGQQQQVAIARGLMASPRLLLLDEPFIGVAPKVIDEILDALRRIVAEGVTVLLVEQNIHRALNFANRAYVIENGRTVLEGNRESLLDNPAFADKFLGLE